MFDAGKTHVAGCACHWRSSAGGRQDSRASCSSSSARWSASMKHSEPLQRQREKKAWAKVQTLQNWEQKGPVGKQVFKELYAADAHTSAKPRAKNPVFTVISHFSVLTGSEKLPQMTNITAK